jgi:beta-galactosidase
LALLLGCGSHGGGTAGGSGGGSTRPPSPRVDQLIDDSWRFYLGDASGADQVDFDDSAWETTTLPHTWNALDGQDGPDTPYVRGIGWYRRHLDVPAGLAGRKLYLQFDGSNLITDVFVNGKAVGTHRGGYARFRFEVTSVLTPGSDNVIAVKVDNSAGVDASHVLIEGSSTVDIAPLSGDFTMYGGLYRSVHLIATHPLAISPLDYGSPGVFIRQSNVSDASAELTVTVKIMNGSAGEKGADVTATIYDATNTVVQKLSASEVVTAGAGADVMLSGTLDHPHLWDGIADPYLYSVLVEVHDGGTVVDAVTQPLGLRSFALDPNTGFSLNGRYLDLHGVNKHQDHPDKGWAISDADTDADFEIIRELGATSLRLAHYQHAEHTYDRSDQQGLVVWAEIPVVNRINDTQGFADNAEQQLIELIRQNYNHPSIVFWSVGNETLLRPGPSPDALIGRLSDVAAVEDDTRLVAYAADTRNEESPVNWHGVAHGFNEYQGWYSGKVDSFASWADAIHAAYPNDCVAVTEFGAGANPTQHAADPASLDTGADHTGMPHTEEYQAYYHEAYWAALEARPFLFGKWVWNGFDFASDVRSEGGSLGINDKGLVSYDRSVKKDAFYWYKANWSSEPFVHITGRRFTDLPAATDEIKVYSNQPSVTLELNGVSLGEKSSASHIFVWQGVTWQTGDNVAEASAATPEGVVTDEVTWAN